ncbi:MAG TPA: prepilin-type N-terminal cleavage/methylation domain-containing protein [Gemmatimonadaceae bacterium]|nr:prepilin-type N-terminal cleavage/methylation domain-containing protein [Gemmatimonadaceae bacterium]
MTRRAGFTFIELLMVVTIIGLLASIAIPKYRTVKRRALATQIVGDVDVLRVASMSFYADSSYFPDDAPAGQVPSGLAPYLPHGFSMRRPGWVLDYDSWSAQSTSLTSPALIAISFETPDDALGQTAISLLDNAASFSSGAKYSVMIAGL